MIQFYFSDTEVWLLDTINDTVTMKLTRPTLDNYSYYPELFVVPSNFSTK